MDWFLFVGLLVGPLSLTLPIGALLWWKERRRHAAIEAGQRRRWDAAVAEYLRGWVKRQEET